MIQTWNVITITDFGSDDNSGTTFKAVVDGDSTVRLVFDAILEYENAKRATPWMSREDLLRLRRVISKALDEMR